MSHFVRVGDETGSLQGRAIPAAANVQAPDRRATMELALRLSALHVAIGSHFSAQPFVSGKQAKPIMIEAKCPRSVKVFPTIRW